MKKQKSIVVFLLFICTCVYFSSFAQSSQKVGKTYAVVIGISGYQDASIPSLNYADKDAGLFAQWLQSKAGGSVPDYQVKLLTNQNATIAAVYNALDWLDEKAKPEDVVYIYFSGHGDVETKDSISQGYLLAWNSPPNNYRNNALGVSDLNNTANTLTTKNKAKVILITDACHSGKMAGDFYKGKQLTAHNLNLVLNNQVRLAACREDEEAAEGPAWGDGRGVFSYYLLMGLNGKAVKDDRVRLQDLQAFLNTSFENDRQLKLENHQQHPVIDGSPIFPMAAVDSVMLYAIEKGAKVANVASTSGLQSLKSVGPQPMDYFFAIAKQSTLDNILPFENYTKLPPDDVPLKMLSDYIVSIRESTNLTDSIYKNDSIRVYSRYVSLLENPEKIPDQNDSLGLVKFNNLKASFKREQQYLKDLYVQTHDTINNLKVLQKQLQNNSYSRNRFTEKFVQLIHEKGQDIINAYLKGDLAELEKRQYYYSGSRNYSAFLPIITTAIHLTPENNYLNGILKIDQAYLAGVINRLNITTHQNKSDSLLNAAFKHEFKAIKLEPYAAYIHNELGNLYFLKHNYDSAAYHFNYASLLSPAWAIPWSNKIRLNLAINNLVKAKEAIDVAETLQPNLAYVDVNAGLVMEKDKNWLAAESYYLNAISRNNVHYLPYERLGEIYIRTGDYEKADSFLYEAKRRKDEFAVNDAVFRFGIELGGRADMNSLGMMMRDCNTTNDSSVVGWERFNLLVRGLAKLSSSSKHLQQEGKDLLKQVALQQPDMILVNHYLGKQYFKEGNWEQAEIEFKKTFLDYKSPEQFMSYLKKALADSLWEHILQNDQLKIPATAINGKKKSRDEIDNYVNSSCLLSFLLYHNYDVVEDHYLLAAIYEKQGFFDEAINQYKIIAGMENIKQMDQALLNGYSEPTADKKNNPDSDKEYLSSIWMDQETLNSKYNNPIRMGGSIKAARLYEQEERYENAEEVLLKQVTQNQAAGYSRQAEMNKENFGPAGRFPMNYYWLDVNKDLESETYNFYNRMLSRFPRNAYWHKKAGLFLYNRLALTYNQISIAERNAFYKYSLEKAYPFAGSIEGPNQQISFKEGGFISSANVFNLPGTNEEIEIDTSTYDPLMQSAYFLEQSIKFSGDIAPDPVVLEDIADLQSWMNKMDSAINNYQYLVQLQPENATLRNKLINYLVLNNKLPQASAQLDSLYHRKQTRHTQLLQLADYKMMNKKHEDVPQLLNEYVPANAVEKNKKLALYVKHFMLLDEPKIALSYLMKITEPPSKAEDDYSNENNKLVQENNSSIYTEARIYALSGRNNDALATLKSLLDTGFGYQYVLNTDYAWDKLRSTRKWQALLQSYLFNNLYEDAENYQETPNTNTVSYRIPILNYKFGYK